MPKELQWAIHIVSFISKKMKQIYQKKIISTVWMNFVKYTAIPTLNQSNKLPWFSREK